MFKNLIVAALLIAVCVALPHGRIGAIGSTLTKGLYKLRNLGPEGSIAVLSRSQQFKTSSGPFYPIKQEYEEYKESQHVNTVPKSFDELKDEYEKLQKEIQENERQAEEEVSVTIIKTQFKKICHIVKSGFHKRVKFHGSYHGVKLQ